MVPVFKEKMCRPSPSAFNILVNDSTYYVADFMELFKRQFYNIKHISKAMWREQRQPINGLLLTVNFRNRNIIQILNHMLIFLVYLCGGLGVSKPRGGVRCVIIA